MGCQRRPWAYMGKDPGQEKVPSLALCILISAPLRGNSVRRYISTWIYCSIHWWRDRKLWTGIDKSVYGVWRVREKERQVGLFVRKIKDFNICLPPCSMILVLYRWKWEQENLTWAVQWGKTYLKNQNPRHRRSSHEAHCMLKTVKLVI